MPDLDKAAGVIAGRLIATSWQGDAEIMPESIHDAVKALSDAGLILPDGFVAVPREPTEAMLAAAIPAIISMETRGDEEDAARADAAERSVRGPRQRLAAQYRAMIQAQETQG